MCLVWVIREVQTKPRLFFFFHKVPVTWSCGVKSIILIEDEDIGKAFRILFKNDEISLLFIVHFIHYPENIAVRLLDSFQRKYKGEKEAYNQNALAMSTKSRDLRLAPPTRPPSTSRQANNSAAFPGFTLPPYKIEMLFAVSSLY